MATKSSSAKIASNANQQYSEREAQQRFMATLKAAVNTPPKPLKSMTPKRPKVQRKRLAKKAK